MTGMVQRELLGVYWTVRTKLEIELGLSVRSNVLIAEAEPTWAILRSMLDRAFEHTEACIVSFVTGSPAASEIISRSVVEAALNVMYVLNGDRTTHLAQYFSNYFSKEERELKTWEDTIFRLKGPDPHIHQLAIQQKREALKKQEAFINQSYEELGLPSGRQKGWPGSISNMFKLLGVEIDYYTVYAAMCSQTHNDAEDLINYLYFTVLGNDVLLRQIGVETVNFSRMLMYWGIYYYLEAARNYAKCFELQDSATKIENGCKAIYEQLEEIGREINPQSS